MNVRRVLVAAGLIAATMGATAAPALAAPPGATAPTVTFTLLTPLPTDLAVGETALICVRAESDEPFVMAIALSDAYYPGRGVLFNGSSAETGATSADLCLTITGRDSTADLAAVTDWPTDEDWPAGVAILAVRVGARFGGGAVVSTGYLFTVAVA